jgi:PAS domain S-box-containing protein
MNTKWKVITSVLLMILVICVVFLGIIQRQYDGRMETLVSGKAESATLLADTLMSDLAGRYCSRIKAFVNPEFSPARNEMLKAFDEQDRDRLLTLSRPLYDSLHQENRYFDSIGWILPDNRVFLRVHKPDKYGDDISRVRKDVATVNREHRQISGFYVGIMSLQYRIVQPVSYQGRYIGAVQFGIHADVILDTLKQRLGTLTGFAIDNREYEFVGDSDIARLRGRDYTVRSHDLAHFKPVVDQLDWSRDRQYIILDGSPWVLVKVLPITDFRNKKLGSLFVGIDLSDEEAVRNRLLLLVLSISGLLLAISFVILYFSYGRLVERIVELNQSLEQGNRDLEARVRERTEKLRESEQRLQRILDLAPVGIIIVGVDSLRIKYANQAVSRMLGRAKEDLEGRSIESLLATDGHGWIREELQAHIDGRKSSSQDISFVGADDRVMQADVISAPFSMEGRLCLLGFIIDECRRKELGARLNRAQKMEAVGMMAGGVAHDLNNILSGIISYPEMLLMRLPEDSDLCRPLRAIQDSGRRAAIVVEDLLTIARGVASTREPHDLNRLVEEYLESPECERLFGLYSNLECRQRIEAENAVVLCSPVHLKKSIMNLMTNAVEAAGEGGLVEISTVNRVLEGEEAVDRELPPGPYVVLGVWDNGPGIALEDIEHIFEPFYSRKVMGSSGSGLGLTVVWNTVQEHGGAVFVTSDDRGSLFELYLPVTETRQKDTVGSGWAELPRGHGESILVVDDESQLRDIAGRILSLLGYRVLLADSGEEALALLAEYPMDLVVLDMIMEPGLSGRETFEQILVRYPGQKAVVATGFSDSEDVRATMEQGAGGFIRKPYTMEQLARVVRDVLDGS